MKKCKNCRNYGQTERGENCCYKKLDYIQEDIEEFSCQDFELRFDLVDKIMLAFIVMVAFLILSILGILWL